MSGYFAELYYGWEDGESGVYHAFELTDPDVIPDDTKMAEKLSAMLDLQPDNEDFNFDIMRVRIPDSIVEKIRRNTERSYVDLVSDLNASVGGDSSMPAADSVKAKKLIAELSELLWKYSS